MKDAILRGARKISALLDVEFGYSSARHSFELGLPLENALRSFFRPFFPTRYGFSAGYIVDEADRTSDQVDWIIYDAVNAAPIIPKFSDMDNIEWFVADCVYGAVEVKRTLNLVTLRRSCEQSASVKDLYREPTHIYRFFPYADFKPIYAHLIELLADHERYCNYLYSGVYGFQIDSSSDLHDPRAFLNAVTSIADVVGYQRMPDFIAVHGRWFVRKVEWSKTSDDGTTCNLTRFLTSTNGFALLETEEMTAGIVYLDLVNQFANTLLSMSYQSRVLDQVLRQIGNGDHIQGKVILG